MQAEVGLDVDKAYLMRGAGLHRWFSGGAARGQGGGGKLQEAAGGYRKLAGWKSNQIHQFPLLLSLQRYSTVCFAGHSGVCDFAQAGSHAGV
jgi:hypothetical protein